MVKCLSMEDKLKCIQLKMEIKEVTIFRLVITNSKLQTNLSVQTWKLLRQCKMKEVATRKISWTQTLSKIDLKKLEKLIFT